MSAPANGHPDMPPTAQVGSPGVLRSVRDDDLRAARLDSSVAGAGEAHRPMSFGLVVLAVDSGQPMLWHGLWSSAAGVCITPRASWTNASSGSVRSSVLATRTFCPTLTILRAGRASLNFLFGQTGQAKSAAVMPAGWPGGHCTSSIL
jgi:hypothetical protein